MITRSFLLLGENFAVTCALDSMYIFASEPPTPPPTTSPPTEAAPPSELFPTRESPSNTLSPALTPNTNRLSWAEVAKLPAKPDTKHDFLDLIAVLGDLSAKGNPRPRFATVSSLLRDRKPDMAEAVDVTQFKAYLQLAESAGIVTLEHRQDGDGDVTLCRQRNTSSDGPSQHTQSQRTGSRFCNLVKVLNDLRLAGDPEPRFSAVTRLLRNYPSVYKDAGVTKFKDYVEAAVEARFVTVRDGVNKGDGWLKLCPAYSDPPVRPSTSASTSSIPPTRAASVPSPFAPLVDFLKSKQSISVQPVPFSDVFSHFISALGYPDLVSLYTSAPGVTTFNQYIDAAIASGLVLLVSGTTASRDALLSLRDTKPSPSPEPQLPVLVSPTTPHHGSFEPLIRTLTKLWYEDKREPPLSEVRPLLLAQDAMAYEKVGAETIEDYVIKAAAENLVIYNSVVMSGIFSMATTIRLREPPQLPNDPSLSTRQNVPTTPLPSLPPPQKIAIPPPPTNVTPKPFQDLVAVLTKLRESTGESEPRFSSVVPLLLTRRPDAYASVGATKFTEYIALAKKNGVIKIRWAGRREGRDGWVSLAT